MKIYLAARYLRRLELCYYRTQIQQLGLTVNGRWLDGAHEIIAPDETTDPSQRSNIILTLILQDIAREKKDALLEAKFADEDFQDVAASDLLIAFTETPNSGFSRGGRHVKLGIAMGMGKKVWVVGHRENVFCWHEGVIFFQQWEDAFAALKSG